MSMNKRPTNGYTLIELMVSIGLFAIIMTLVAGAYFMIINISRQAQAISTAVDGVSYALEDMSRTIRTGTAYSCQSLNPGDNFCQPPSGGTSFSLVDQTKKTQTFKLVTTNGVGTIYQNTIPLTDPSINVTSLTFYTVGANTYTTYTASGDTAQPQVTIVVSGTVLAGKQIFPFTIETGATTRTIDL